MTNILLGISIVLAAVCVILLVLLLLRQKRSAPQHDGRSDEELYRLAQRTENIGSLADFTARTVENMSRSTEAQLLDIRNRLAEDIKYIVESNARNLETIRRTVDDKLSASLDGKLSASYAHISERLEKMYESVGEMKSLSAGIGDIRRVFANVKLRGTWGETQLDALLSQMLSPDQYARSVKVNPLDNCMVDFAVLLPAKDGVTLLPIDSKFPVEEFERLCEASERGDAEGAERARRNLERAVKTQADSIAKKYILPPRTTDFAVMYLPSEALYAEVLKIAGLPDFLRAKRILASGPTNLAALLSTLQTGFRTAAIEKRSGELIRMLEELRSEFARFSEGLERTRKKLQEAQDAVDYAKKRGDTISRRLSAFRPLTPPGEDGGEE